NKPRCSPSDQQQNEQNSPIVCIAVSGHREMIADHEEDNRHRHKSIVLGAQLGLCANRGIEPVAACGSGDQFSLTWQNSEQYVGSKNRAQYGSQVDVGRTTTQKVKQCL